MAKMKGNKQYKTKYKKGVQPRQKHKDLNGIYKVRIELLSPLYLSSGRADVNIDANVVHDMAGVPFFPGRRLKGLLYESLLEIKEMLELGGADVDSRIIEELFQQCADSPVQMIIHDFHVENYAAQALAWRYLQERYPVIIRPAAVLDEYTSLRYQTAIDAATGTAAEGSFRNMRVVDAPLVFEGEIQLLGATEKHEQALLAALTNLRRAGQKRNRGLGHIKCTVSGMDMDFDFASIMAKEAE